MRSFDVPLMVILSGYLFHMTNKKWEAKFSFFSYLKKRFTRLVLPTWIFLTLFFWAFYLLDVYKYTSFPFSQTEIQTSYFLWTGIGYVWIIRIYLLVALFWPLFVWIFSKIKWKYTVLTVLFIGYTLLWQWFQQNYSWEYKEVVTRGVFFLLPYLLLFLYGVFFKEQNIWKKISMTIVFWLLLVYQQYELFWWGKDMLRLQEYKYPAREAYFFYWIWVSTLLIIFAEWMKNIRYGILEKPLLWLGSSTLTLYLTHIPFIVYFEKYTLGFSWQEKFFYTAGGAIIVTLCIQGIIYGLIKLLRIPPRYAKGLKTVFCS
jgi:peptidoglycan/LPS O-acetylase OafA/YrhL